MRALALLVLVLSGEAAAAVPCTRARLDAFVVRAQSGEASAEGEGRALLACRDLSAAALPWLAFVMSWAGDVARSQRIDEAPSVLPSLSGPSKTSVIARARAGNYRELLSKVDRRDAVFVGDMDAQLALARVMARKGQYNRARDAYAVYLAKRPGDADVEAESLYTYIWEKHPEARARFDAASARPGASAMRGVIARGLTLLSPAKASTAVASKPAPSPPPAPPPAIVAAPKAQPQAQASAQPSQPSQAPAAKPHIVQATAAATIIRRAYRRDSLGASYAGLFDLSLASHRIDVMSVDKDRAFGTEAHLGFDERFANTALDLTRDDVAAGFAYGRYVDAASTLSRDGDYAAYERHRLLARIPFRPVPERDWFAARTDIALELRPRPNPNYDTAARLETVALGVEWEHAVGARAVATAAADYGLARWTDRAGDAREIAFTSAAFGAKLALTDTVALALAAHHVRADEDALLSEQAMRSGVTLTLESRLPRP